MDDATLKAFKVKFIRLTILLNVGIVLVAMAFIAYVKLESGMHVPVSALLGTSAIIVFAYFWRLYRAEQRWLKENA